MRNIALRCEGVLIAREAEDRVYRCDVNAAANRIQSPPLYPYMASRFRHLLVMLPRQRTVEWLLWAIFVMLSIYLLSFAVGTADFIRFWTLIGGS